MKFRSRIQRLGWQEKRKERDNSLVCMEGIFIETEYLWIFPSM